MYKIYKITKIIEENPEIPAFCIKYTELCDTNTLSENI